MFLMHCLTLWHLGHATSSSPVLLQTVVSRRLTVGTLDGNSSEFDCRTVCPQEWLDLFSNPQDMFCGPGYCLPFIRTNVPEYFCVCPSSHRCMASLGNWLWDYGPSVCPLNRSSGKCDYEGVGRWLVEHPQTPPPGIEAVEGCYRKNVESWGEWCDNGFEEVGEITECTTTTTTPSCTPHQDGYGELACPVSSSLERFLEVPGACRGASSNDYCDSYFELFEDLDLTQCQRRCAERANCAAVSFAPGRCELWTREVGAVEESQDSSCFKKQDCELVPSGWTPYSYCGQNPWPNPRSAICDLTCPEGYGLHCNYHDFTDSCSISRSNDITSSAYVVKQSGCSGSRCHESYRQCCACRREDLGFKPVSGDGQHQACRGKDAADNSPSHYILHEGVQSLEDCKLLCMESPSCQGIEFSSARCEVWTRAEGIESVASIIAFDITCLRLVSNLPEGQVCKRWEALDGELWFTCLEAESPPELTKPVSFAPVDGGHSKACRGFAGDNSQSNYELLSGVESLEKCRRQCLATTACKGIEFSMGRCEVWTSEVNTSITLNGFTCERVETFSLVDGGAGRACRGTSPSDNSASYYALASDIASLEECQSQCLQLATCIGIEYSKGRCELWSSKVGASIALDGYECQQVSGPPWEMPRCNTWEQIPSSSRANLQRTVFRCV